MNIVTKQFFDDLDAQGVRPYLTELYREAPKACRESHKEGTADCHLESEAAYVVGIIRWSRLHKLNETIAAKYGFKPIRGNKLLMVRAGDFAIDIGRVSSEGKLPKARKARQKKLRPDPSQIPLFNPTEGIVELRYAPITYVVPRRGDDALRLSTIEDIYIGLPNENYTGYSVIARLADYVAYNAVADADASENIITNQLEANIQEQITKHKKNKKTGT